MQFYSVEQHFVVATHVALHQCQRVFAHNNTVRNIVG